jgi:hypothetical protein
MVDNGLPFVEPGVPGDQHLIDAAEDPENAYESELDESAIGINRTASPPDGVDSSWETLHPSFAAEKNGAI